MAQDGKWKAGPFTAPFWLPSPHAQTIGGRLFRRPGQFQLRRERLTTPDGDFLDLDFAPAIEGAPIVLLLHGLEGSATRGYALITYQALAERGIASVGLNFRSCSGEINRVRRMYHSGETEDIRFVLSLLRERYPSSPIGAIGFSLGGNALLKYMGEEGDNAIPSAVAAVSVPYDLAAGDAFMAKSVMGRFYTSIFVKPLVQKVLAKRHLLMDIDVETARRARTFREFDHTVTAPIHGFASADDYYTRSSSGQFIGRIRKPTLLLHAEDDPFIPREAIPLKAIAENPHVQASIQKEGGHVGFIYGTPLRPKFWAETNASEFLAQKLKT